MGRPHRIDTPGSWYHVVNRGAARQAIFFGDRDRVEFERLLGVINERFGVRVHAFCQMTNHYHLLLECPDGGLSDAMHLLGSVYVRRVNERQGRDGPLFRDRFYAKTVTSDAYLMRLIPYIHRNPLAFCTVEQLRSYRWSSLRVYLGHRRTPSWMVTDNVINLFDGVDRLDECIIGGAHGGMPSLKSECWASAIELMIDERLDDRPHQGVSRTVAVLLLDHLDGDQRTALASTLQFPSPTAERMARYRARHALEAHPELGEVVAGVIDLAA